MRIGRTPGSPDLGQLHGLVHAIAPGVVTEEVDIVGPPISAELRGAGWVEVLAALHGLGTLGERREGTGRAEVRLPGGGRAAVTVETLGGAHGRGTVTAEIWAGEILHQATLRSYVIGAVHQALGLVWSEGIAVDAVGAPLDLTIRSFGILTAPPRRPLAGQRVGCRLRGHGGRGVASRGYAADLADSSGRHWSACPLRRTIGTSRGERMSPALGPYSPVRRVGDWVITSGQIGLATDESGTTALVDGGAIPQLRQALTNVAARLRDGGATMHDVVKTTLYLTDMGDYPAANEVWVEYFSQNRPTRSAVAVAALPGGALVEVEAWAYVPGGTPVE
jgi:2-iminobutanoate/2-iminopropanoate deaminase